MVSPESWGWPTYRPAGHSDHRAAVVPPPGVEAGALSPGGRGGVQDVDLVQVVPEAVRPPLTPGLSPAPDEEDERWEGESAVVRSQGPGRLRGRTEAPGQTWPAGENLDLRSPGLTVRLAGAAEHKHLLAHHGGGRVARLDGQRRRHLPASLWSGRQAGVTLTEGVEAIRSSTDQHQATNIAGCQASERPW